MSVPYPVIIAEWPRNNRERLRIALDEFNNRQTVDIRCWWQDAEGAWRPGRAGVTLAVRHLPALVDGLAEALRQAQAMGLVEMPARDRTAASRAKRYRTRKRERDANDASRLFPEAAE